MNPQKSVFYVDGYCRTFVHLEDYDELMAYCDKLVDFLPCLPKDVENLREANAQFANDNECLKRDVEIAESQVRFLQERLEKERKEVARLSKEKEYYLSVVKEHAEAASIFQVDGKYYKEANLCIGDSTVVEGIKWLDMSLEGYKQKWKDALKENKLLRLDLDHCKIGRNVAASAWDEAQQKIDYLELACTRAEERAEIAEKHLDKIKKILNLPT